MTLQKSITPRVGQIVEFANEEGQHLVISATFEFMLWRITTKRLTTPNEVPTLAWPILFGSTDFRHRAFAVGGKMEELNPIFTVVGHADLVLTPSNVQWTEK